MSENKKLKDSVVIRRKTPTWIELLISLKVGENFPIYYSNANYVCSEISKTIKYRYPDMRFKTYTKTEDGVKFKIIERVK